MMTLPVLAIIGESILTITFCLILATGIYTTLYTRFIQVRMFPRMLHLLWNGIFANKELSIEGLPPYKALFAAMSTTIGIGNIVGPAVAIRLGGPGAFIGFLLATFFGASLTYTEVLCAMRFREKNNTNLFVGGPMYYLKHIVGSWASSIYAATGSLLLAIWCSNQSNTLADILLPYSIPSYITGLTLALLVYVYLLLGIKQIGNLASALVPAMFFLYCGAALCIIITHAHTIPSLITQAIQSALSSQAIAGSIIGLNIQHILRWGLAKGTQACEAGIGTASILHVQSSEKTTPESQAILSMASVYSVAFVCTLSALVTLTTGSWNNPNINLGIAMIAHPFTEFFIGGKCILAASAFLFGFGTILGNAYNGSRCFTFLTHESTRYLPFYYCMIGIVVFFGAILDVQLVWTISDYFIIPVALINCLGIVKASYKQSLYSTQKNI